MRRIYRACRPTLLEPNLALNLEICDYVNAKQGSVPREAAICVAKLINQRDPQTAKLALHLLDNLVKNCGYPFHLQISRKEFLNELVKKFPERPTLRYNSVQRMVLAQIEEWYQTICKTSKYKEDFGYIRDMHRLLLNKGYIFPEVKVEDAAVLNPSDNLKSLEDIQKEEAIVHSAKLQELIRRGKPQDLQEANKLMKIMAGFKDTSQENKKQVTDDVARLKRKTEIFAEMLNTIQGNGQTIDESNETLFELYGSIKSSQPIVTKIIEEENDNEEYVQDLLALNDTINQLVEKFQLLKNGDVDQAANIKVSGGTQGASAAKELNLIDFDDEPLGSSDPTGKDQQGYDDLLSDLSNLAFTNGASGSTNNKVNPLDFFGAGGSIALGGSTTPQLGASIQQPTPSTQRAPATASNFDFLSDLNSPSPQLQSNTTQSTQSLQNSQNSLLDPFGFNFPSSTPSQVQLSSNASVKVLNESGVTKLEVELRSQASSSQGKFYVSNTQSATLSGVKFLVAVPKSCKLDLKPQSGDVIYGFANRGFSQEFSIENPNNKALKVKWKIEYTLNGQGKEETGVSVLSD